MSKKMIRALRREGLCIAQPGEMAQYLAKVAQYQGEPAKILELKRLNDLKNKLELGSEMEIVTILFTKG